MVPVGSLERETPILMWGVEVKTLFLTFLIILLSLSQIEAANYYYNSTSGNDANNCTTPALACKTLADLQSWVVPQNSTVFFNGCEEPYRGKYGRNSQNTTYTSYGSCGKAKIWGSVNASAAGNWTSLGGNLYQFTCSACEGTVYQIFYNVSPMIDSYVKLGKRDTSGVPDEDWEFYYNTTSKGVKVYLAAGNPGTYGNGIEVPAYNRTTMQAMWNFDTFNKINITNLEFSFANYAAIYAYVVQNVTIYNCTFKFIYEKSLNLELGNNHTVTDNTFYKSGIRGAAAPEGQGGMGENIWINRVVGSVVRRNSIERCGGVCINPYHAIGLQINNNKVFNSQQDLTDWSGGIYLDGCNDSVISYNNVTDTQIGIIVGSEISGWGSQNITIHNNIIANNTISDFVIDSSGGLNTTKVNFTQNTLFKSYLFSGSGFGNQILLQDYINVTMKNNLIFNNYTNTTSGMLISIYNGTSGTTLGTIFTSDFNSWNSTNRQTFDYDGSTLTSIASWRSVSGQDNNSLTQNPLFLTGTYTPSFGNPVCTASSNGSYIGALPCSEVNADPCLYVSGNFTIQDSICNITINANLGQNHFIIQNSTVYNFANVTNWSSMRVKNGAQYHKI